MKKIFLPLYSKIFKKNEYNFIIEEYFFDLHCLNKKNHDLIKLKYNKKNFYNNYKFLKKKIKTYKIQIFKQLKNKYNQKILKYYDAAVEFWLIHFLSCIKLRYDKTLEVKKKYKNVILPKLSFGNFYFDRTEDFMKCFRNDSINNIYIYQKIAEKIDVELVSFKLNQKKIVSQNNTFKNKIKHKIIYFTLKLIKPHLHVDTYLKTKTFNIKNILLDRTIFTNSEFLKGFFKKEEEKVQIKIKEIDKFDMIINLFLNEFYPNILIPNKNLINDLGTIRNNIKGLHSSIALISCDEYRILSNMLKRDKVKTYQHGGGYNLTDCNLLEDYEKKYSTFEGWNTKKSYNFFFKEIESKKTNIVKSRTNITFFSSINYLNGLRYEYNKVNFVSNKININNLSNFYKDLNIRLKKRLIIRNNKHNYGWNYEKMFRKFCKVKFLGEFKNSNSSLDSIVNSKIFLTDFFSTAYFESLVYGIPSFAYFNTKNYCFNKETLKIINKLKGLNIIFENHKECAKFLNKHYDTIENFWYSKNVQIGLNEFKNKIFQK